MLSKNSFEYINYITINKALICPIAEEFKINIVVTIYAKCLGEVYDNLVYVFQQSKIGFCSCSQ